MSPNNIVQSTYIIQFGVVMSERAKRKCVQNEHNMLDECERDILKSRFLAISWLIRACAPFQQL